MNDRRARPILLGIGIVIALGTATAARAQLNRVFVSARSGSDLNSCNNINTPCQSFQGAVNQVAAGGTVIVLDTGGYGPVTIGKSLTIDSTPGIVAFIHPPTGNAITINSGASDTIVLRSLSLNVGNNIGILVNTAGAVHVEGCAINGFSVEGLLFLAPGGQLFVKDTTFSNNGGAGVSVDPASGGANATFDRCRFEGNGNALFVGAVSAGAGTNVTVRDGVASGNFRGYQGGTANGQSVQLNLERCVATSNFVGIFAADGANTKVRVSDSVVIGNNLGLEAQGAGSILSRGNNTVESNGGLQTFTGSYAAK